MPMICKTNNTNMLQHFKNYGINALNLSGADNQNCLHYALSKGKFEMVKYALENTDDKSKMLNQ